MTNEEAIRLLNELYIRADLTDEYGDCIDTSPYDEAIELAIKALEKYDRFNGICDEREAGNCPYYTARGDL